MGGEIYPRSVVFVIGMYESGLEIVAEELHLLGLRRVASTSGSEGPPPAVAELSRFSDELLGDLGATWDEPVLLPRLELWRRLANREEEARSVFAQACQVESEDEGGPNPWVWADPRNVILAPFWIRALDLAASVVLVHRRPAEVAAEVSAKEDLTFDRGLVLWDGYNRSALSLWEEVTGIIVGIETLENDVPAGVERLREYLRGMGVDSTEEQADSALTAFRGLDQRRRELPDSELPNRFRVLDRVLSQAELTTSADTEAMVQGFASYYNEAYYTQYGSEGGAPYRPGEPQWTGFFSTVADRIRDDIGPESVLDAGCAIGFLVEALRARGVQAWGIDVSDWAISQVPPSVGPFCSASSLTEEISGHYDLVTIIEVIEHMPESAAGPVIANVTRHAESVLFSSTPDGFEEATHINVRTPDHWARLFAANGFFRDFGYDATYLSQDAVLFRRGSPEMSALIVGYEQTMWSERKRLFGLLDESARQRSAQASTIGDHVERSELLERNLDMRSTEVDDLTCTLQELERRRRAESLTAEAAVLHRDLEIAGLKRELEDVRNLADALTTQVLQMESTMAVRYHASLRRFCGWLRRTRWPQD